MEFMTALGGGLLDEQKPSLFELLSEQQLAALLPPTLRYLLAVATHRHPRYLLRILNRFDELYALSSLLVERHYLRTRGGAFTEHFYGLKRERALAAEIPRAASAAPAVVRDTLKLSNADVWKNLAVLVGIPYLKRKLDEAYEVNAPRALLGGAYNRLPENPTLKDKVVHYFRWFLRNVYPSINAGYYFAMLAFHLAYLFDNTKYHSPFLWLIGTRIRRMNGADYRAIELLSQPAKAAAGASPGPRSLFSPQELGSRALSSLSILLPTSIFALKFLEWWHASDFAAQLSRRATESLDLPPPTVSGLPDGGLKGILKKEGSSSSSSSSPVTERRPETDRLTDQAEASTAEEKPPATPLADTAPIAASSLLPILTVPAPADSDRCPICDDEVTTATACQTGIVYCYTCIYRWVSGQHPRQESFMADKAGRWESGLGRCAVTGRRVLGGTEGLRRIMV